MPDLIASGCPHCDRAVAIEIDRIQALPGYLSAEQYAHRYQHLPEGAWPHPVIDGEDFMDRHVTGTISGDDGLLLRHAGDHPYICPVCGESPPYEVWRGHVELREVKG